MFPHTLLRTYKAKAFLGAGAFSPVWLCKDRMQQKRVALKIFKTTSESFEKEKEILRLIKEQHLSGFPLLHDHGVIDTDGEIQSYIAMTAFSMSLDEFLKQDKGNIQLKDILLIGLQLFNRLEALHGIGVIHNDLKPDNIMIEMVNEVPKVYIIDFGISNVLGDTELDEQRLDFQGNIFFSSPFRLAFQSPRQRDDLISAIYVLLYMLDKRLIPWHCTNDMEVQEVFDFTKKLKQRIRPVQLCKGRAKFLKPLLEYAYKLDREDPINYQVIYQHLISYLRPLLSQSENEATQLSKLVQEGMIPQNIVESISISKESKKLIENKNGQQHFSRHHFKIQDPIGFEQDTGEEELRVSPNKLPPTNNLSPVRQGNTAEPKVSQGNMFSFAPQHINLKRISSCSFQDEAEMPPESIEELGGLQDDQFQPTGEKVINYQLDLKKNILAFSKGKP